MTKKPCPRCKGKKREADSTRACSKCGGTGEVHSTTTLAQLAERVAGLIGRGHGSN